MVYLPNSSTFTVAVYSNPKLTLATPSLMMMQSATRRSEPWSWIALGLASRALTLATLHSGGGISRPNPFFPPRISLGALPHKS